MLPTARNNNNAHHEARRQAEAAMAEYVKHYPNGAFPVPSCYAHPIVLKQMTDAIEEGRAVTVPEALVAVEKRLQALNADVQVEQEEYDEVVVIKAMFLKPRLSVEILLRDGCMVDAAVLFVGLTSCAADSGGL